LAFPGATNTAIFEDYVEKVLVPELGGVSRPLNVGKSLVYNRVASVGLVELAA
jgi:hypothetical protein